jgi:AmmeMemoRadiSam system protein B
MIRKAIYAGTWYPDTKAEILKFLNPKTKPARALGCLCPHAGWIYSGKVAGLVYSLIQPAELYILIGPNHTGAGAAVSVFPEGEWETPLGNLEVDEKVAASITKAFPKAVLDTEAHLNEHSIEVQLPFIKLLNAKAKIVPICLGDYSTETCKRLASAIFKTIEADKLSAKTLLVASSDMSHYVSADEAKTKDNMAIKNILDLDAAGLLETVRKNDISMCGSGPASVVISATNELGAKKAALVSYTNSGYVSGDFGQVVAYAGIIIT